MIKAQMELGEEEYRVLTDLVIDSKPCKRKRAIWAAILILAGLYLLILGLKDLLSAVTVLSIFCLVMAAAAFFLAFGGEKMLNWQAVYRKSKKANEKAAAGTRYYTFDEEQCTLKSNIGGGKYKWDAFKDYGEHTHYLWMQRVDNAYVLVDKNKMSPEDCEKLKSYCFEKIEKK